MELVENLVKLFPFFTPDSHYATKPYLFGCLCSNYALLCLIRASAEPRWILGLVNPSDALSTSPISISSPEIIILSLAGFCAILNQCFVTLRRLGHLVSAVTRAAAILCGIHSGLLLTLTIRFALQYPYHIYRYAPGGYCALFSATLATLLAFIFFSADVFYFSSVSSESSLEQKKYEFANLLFILYILFGAGWFCYLEGWGFERASQFCLMTLLTIGYGNIVPSSFGGRFFMIIYTGIGLCVAGFFIIAVEDVIIQDADLPGLKSSESILSFSSPNDPLPFNTSDNTLDPDLINQLPPIPLSQTITNTSMMSRNSIMSRDSDYPFQQADPLWLRIWNGAKISFWMLGWWLGAGGVFAYFEQWPYFNGIYFAFVSMTGIGYGDFTIHSPAAVEIWWIFLFNVISIIAYFISLAGRTIAKKVAAEQAKIHRKRLVRRLKRNRIKGRADNIQPTLLSQQPSVNQNSFTQYFGSDRNFNEPEMIEMNQKSIPRRVNVLKTHGLHRNSSSQRLQNLFVIGGTSDTASSNPRPSYDPSV